MGDFVPGYEASALQGMGAPRNTPAEIEEKLNQAVNLGLADPKLKARFTDLGRHGVSAYSSPGLASSWRKKRKNGAKVIQFSGAKAD